jgi:hypothetical protein
MNTLSAITTIARFEAKTLARGWFFRIFAALAIIIVFFFNLVGFTALGDGGWPGRLIPGSVPYMNLFLLNISQAVIAIFISSDFLGRDKKLDTTEAFYVRSVSNFAYVTGKTLGIIKVFFFLNLVVLVIGAIFNIIATDVDIIPVTYLIYPLLLSLPTMLLILGMSFFLMVLIRNQAVTFILMLGFLGASLFYLSNLWYNVFDFVGFSTPMVYSIFTGLPDIGLLILMRGAYALLGLSFVFFTILMLPRLPQEHYFKVRAYAGIVITLLPAIVMLSAYVMINKSGASLRSDMLSLEESLPVNASAIVNSAHFGIEHKGKSLSIHSLMEIEAFKNTQLFILNPGFKVHEVKVNGKSVDFERELHLLRFQIEDSEIDGHVKIEISYKGKPDNSATFVEIPEDIRVERNRLDPLVAGKDVAFVTSSYILLTREAAWYPVAASREYRSQPQFTKFSIDANVSDGLTAITQGQILENDNGMTTYTSTDPLNALSFTVGPYVVNSVMIDSLEVSLVVHPKNLRFLNYFSNMADTIPHLIKEMKENYERKIGHAYPFRHFSLVEAPIHFHTYPRSWTLATEDNMPGQVFVPERGAGGFQADIKRQQRWMERQNQQDGENLLPEEMQARLFKNVTGNMLITPSGSFRWRDARLRNLPGWSKQSIFPQYLSYTIGIEQEGFPILQFITENYMFSRAQTSGPGGFGPGMGSASDQIILKMKGKNLIQLLDSMRYDPQLTEIVSRKGAQFFSTVQMNIYPKDIDAVLDEIIAMQNFTLLPVDTFITRLNTFSDSDISSAIESWQLNASTPAFLFGATQTFEITEANQTRYFVRTRVVNNGDGDGILTIGIREQMRERGGGRRAGGGGGFGGFGPGGGGGMPAPSVEQTFLIPKGENVEIGMITNGEPRELILNTYLAANLPSTQRLMIEAVSGNRATVFEGVQPYNGTISFNEPFEFIVDNEDIGFSIINQQEKRTAKDWWMSRSMEQTGDKYQGVNTWMPSHRWQPTLDANYFGKYVKSAVYKRSGTGDAIVKWETELAESGNVAVHAFVPQTMRRGGPRGWQNEETGSYEFTVFHDDGETIVEIDPSREQSGWILLGDFYISRGNAVVTLSDKTTRNLVIADAVKWVSKK